jgi:hypothetical protein
MATGQQLSGPIFTVSHAAAPKTKITEKRIATPIFLITFGLLSWAVKDKTKTLFSNHWLRRRVQRVNYAKVYGKYGFFISIVSPYPVTLTRIVQKPANCF